MLHNRMQNGYGLLGFTLVALGLMVLPSCMRLISPDERVAAPDQSMTKSAATSTGDSSPNRAPRPSMVDTAPAAAEPPGSTLGLWQGPGGAGTTPGSVQTLPSDSAMTLSPDAGGETYAKIEENAFASVAKNPLSTFSVDVDTAAYSNLRRFLNEGKLPTAQRSAHRGIHQLLPL